MDDESFSGTTRVADSQRFDEAALRGFFRDRVDDDVSTFRVSQFRGGQSNPTFLVDTGAARYVVRRKPAGVLLPSAHAVEREYRVMAALANTDVPVPTVHALCEDTSVIGTAFYVMAHVDGRILWDPKLPGLSTHERAAICDEMNRGLAALHTVDAAAVGLADFGKPGNYVARQLDRWSRQYRASETERIDAMDSLIAWLGERVPAAATSAIVHGDYRLDNLVFAHDTPRLVAVLDWELSTLGDPIADFAYHCMAWQLPPPLRGLGDLGSGQITALGLPTEQAYLARYCERRGVPPVPCDDWHFYKAFNLFRAAAIAQGIMGRALAGNASNEHALDAGRQARTPAARHARWPTSAGSRFKGLSLPVAEPAIASLPDHIRAPVESAPTCPRPHFNAPRKPHAIRILRPHERTPRAAAEVHGRPCLPQREAPRT